MNVMYSQQNRQNQQQMMLHTIMQYQVAILDLALYLDTHPNDPVALSRHTVYSSQLRKLRDEYEMLYGPLNNYSVETGETWRYINGPWPWEWEWEKNITF